jgi:hypothetical protein
MYQILLSVRLSIVRALPCSPLINDHSDSDSLGLASDEPISAHRFENNSSESLDFDPFLSYENPSADLSNNYPIDPLQQAQVSTADAQTVELPPQAYGVNPSLLTTGPCSTDNMNSPLSGLGSFDGYTSRNAMVGSMAQTLFNDPFLIHQPLQFFPILESTDHGVYFQHSNKSADHSQFGTMGNVTKSTAFSLTAENEGSYNHSMFPEANATSSYSLPVLLSNTRALPDCYNGEDPFCSLQPLSNPTIPSACSHSLALPNRQQFCHEQRQILNGNPDLAATSRRLFSPPRIIKTLPPPRRGGRRGPLSISQLDQRKRAKKQGICIRCRKLKTKASNSNFCRGQI